MASKTEHAVVLRQCQSARVEQPAQKPRCHRSTSPQRHSASRLDVAVAAPACCRRRLPALDPAADEADNVMATAPVLGLREAATVAYIRAHAGNVDDNKDKVLVSFKSAYSSLPVPITASSMSSLTRPASEDGQNRWIPVSIMDAFIHLLRHRHAGGEQIVRNGRRVLLHCGEDRTLIERLADGLHTHDDRAVRHALSFFAKKFLRHDLVFIPVQHGGHVFVAVVNFTEREYQILDSQEPPRCSGAEHYEQGTSKLRACMGRCMAEAGRKDVAGWGLRVVKGLPRQTDRSSCVLFALMFMQRWDGEKLTQSFSMDDVHAFRTKLAEELIFSELNQTEDVRREIELRINWIDHRCTVAKLI